MRASEQTDQPRVLLVDDSRIVRVTAQKYMGGDCNLVLAESGEAAWAEINSDPGILVVFTDVGMEGMDGYELLRRIREDERETINQLPVVIVTGQDEEGARETALARGATDFICKPFDRSELLARARAYATHDRLRRRYRELEACRTQDAATGLGNARYLRQRLHTARAYTLRHDLPLAFLEFEVSAVAGTTSDTESLRAAGHALALRVREADVLVHLGEGRFAVIGPNCDAAGARRLAQRLRDGVAEEGFDTADPVVSAGIYMPPPDPEVDPDIIRERGHEAAECARVAGDGAPVLLGGEAGTTAGPEREAGAITVEDAIARLDRGDEAVEPELPALVERCLRLLEAAPAGYRAQAVRRLSAADPQGADEPVADTAAR